MTATWYVSITCGVGSRKTIHASTPAGRPACGVGTATSKWREIDRPANCRRCELADITTIKSKPERK